MLFVVPLPEPYLWPVFGFMIVIHVVYKFLMASAYQRGAYMVVYPIVRGTGPLVTVLFAGFVFGERFTGTQWLGVLLLSGGIFFLAAFNLSDSRSTAASPTLSSLVASMTPPKLK